VLLSNFASDIFIPSRWHIQLHKPVGEPCGILKQADCFDRFQRVTCAKTRVHILSVDVPNFASPARVTNEVWRLLVGIIAIAIIAGLGLAVYIGAIYLTFPSVMPSIVFGTSPEGVLLMLLSFIVFHVALIAVVPRLHRRSYSSLLGPSMTLNRKHFVFGSVVVALVFSASLLLIPLEGWIFSEAERPILSMSPVLPWAVWLAPAVILLLLQTSAEELVFRGYLLQQLSARFNSIIIWAVLPSFLFGILHFDPETYGANAYLYVLNTTAFGIMASIITLRTGNIGAALGIHFVNNLLALCGVGFAGSFSGLALITMQVDLTGAYASYSMLSQLVFEVTAFLIWLNWMNRHTD
jgi:membrane protease YdiL (CAAX protease family)